MKQRLKHLAMTTLAALGLSLGSLTPVMAQERNSSTPIKIIVGFPAGGLTDIIARTMADRLRVELNRPVLIDNKPGASTRIANVALKNAVGDGNTFMLAPHASPLFIHMLLGKDKLGYDFLHDFTPVATVATYPLGMAMYAQPEIKDIHDFLRWAKTNPEKASFGTGGQGGHTHFSGLMLSQVTGVPMTAVPYRGSAPMQVDLQGGVLPSVVMAGNDFFQHIGNPNIRILGVFSAERSPLAPSVPTFKEQGIDVIGGEAWMGVWANAQAPKEDVERMRAALERVVKQPEYQELMRSKYHMQPWYVPGSEMDRLLRADIERWTPIITKSGFTMDAN